MSDFLHFDLGYLERGSIVNVTLDKRAIVRLLDPSNFQRYQRGENCEFYGGEQVQSPAQLEVPGAGHWHVALDLNGGTGTIQADVQVMSPIG